MQGTTGTAEDLLVSDEGLCFMELVRYYLHACDLSLRLRTEKDQFSEPLNSVQTEEKQKPRKP